jgi:hypothetical protein
MYMNKILSRKSKKSASNKKGSKTNIKSLNFRQTMALLVLATVFLFGASGYYWYQNVFTNPDRVLSDMLDKSLQTTNIQREVDQSQGDSTLNQQMFVSFSPRLFSQSESNLSEITTLGRTDVKTENIGTEDADFVRYTGIEIAGDRTGRDFSKITGVWGKRENQPQSGQPVSFLRDSLFTAVPFGNLNPAQRQEIKDEIKRVGLYQYSEAKREYSNGRPVIVYKIDLDPQALVTVLAKYAEVTGIDGGPELNPAMYQEAQKVPLNITVDLMSRHVSAIEFRGSNRLENYGTYNMIRDVELPKDTIDVNELQIRLQQLEQQS